MLKFLLDHSIPIVFLIAAVLVGRAELKAYMARKTLDRTSLLSLLRQKSNEVGRFILSRLITASVVTLIVSVVSFRELWINDVFHTVFITSLLFNKVEQYLQDLLK